MRGKFWTTKYFTIREYGASCPVNQKRRTYSAEYKLVTVIEVLRGEKSVAQICRERGIKDSLLYKWKQQFEERAGSIFADQRQSGNAIDSAKDEKIAELERIIGQLTVENTILKKAKSLLGSDWSRNGR